jgi:hypothetical protein
MKVSYCTFEEIEEIMYEDNNKWIEKFVSPTTIVQEFIESEGVHSCKY